MLAFIVSSMMKSGVILAQQQQQPPPQSIVLDQENMSNLTSASTEASGSSVSRNDNSYPPQQQQFVPQNHQTQVINQAPPQQQQPASAVKRKRNQPGNPDPEAEVIALSPKTLMATNRFVCEVCNKGFQRDQNLQLHRRGHNLPWKLKQRANKDVVRKKVYVCPETNCVHHDPSRALGDLTGIKKHFCRKHGEKKWKCDKCSKRYAVQSDWKAHSKTCGTREYRCDCGTLFSRRDSFITHRAFCDALAEESARGGGGGISSSSINPEQLLINSSQSSTASHGNNNIPLQVQQHQIFSLKKEPLTFNLRPEIPPWLACTSPGSPSAAAGGGPGPPPSMSTQEFPENHHQEFLVPPAFGIGHENPNPRVSNHHHHLGGGPNFPPFHPATSSLISATALLQKAAQMGASMSSSNKTGHAMLFGPHHGHHVSADSANNNSSTSTTTGFGLNLSSRDHHQEYLVNGLAAFGNKAADSAGGGGGGSRRSPAAMSAGTGSTGGPGATTSHQSFLQDMMMGSSSSIGFEDGSTFLDHHHHHHQAAFGGFFANQKNRDLNFISNPTFSKASSNDVNAGNDGMTRDFLGLRPLLSQSEMFSIANLGNCMSTANGSPNEHHHQDSSSHHHDEEESWQQQG